jgi:hypothetical protein
MTLVPADYAEARRAFLVAARRREFGLESHSVDGHPDLLTDVARLGPLGAAKLLVILSGTHGNEGLAGSAIQRDTIEGLDALLAAHGGLPENFALLLVHAVDPWGMARMRRQNARNIDLNRNFRDWSVPPPPRPVYRELHPPDRPRRPDRGKRYRLPVPRQCAVGHARRGLDPGPPDRGPV